MLTDMVEYPADPNRRSTGERDIRNSELESQQQNKRLHHDEKWWGN
jgi:hypothetical protein